METNVNIKAIECPNCGANATNFQNCEYCGSLLVRFKDLNIAIDPNKYGKTAVTFAGLKDALLENLKEQERTQGLNHVHTWIRNSALGINIEVVNPRATKDMVYFETDMLYHIMPLNDYTEAEQSLVICFRFVELSWEITNFDSNAADIHDYHQALHERFSAMSEFPLFNYIEENLLTTAGTKQGKVHSYYIDFGQDYEGAAEILTQYLMFMYQIPSPTTVRLDYELTSETEEEYVSSVQEEKSFNKGLLIFALLALCGGAIMGFCNGDSEGILVGCGCIVMLLLILARLNN